MNFKPPFLSLKSFLDQDEYEKIGLECQEYLCAASWNLEEIVQGNGQPNYRIQLEKFNFQPFMRGLDDGLTNNSLSPKALTLRILRVFTLDQKSVMKHASGSIIKEWYFLPLEMHSSYIFTKMCNQLDRSQWKYHFQALSLQVAPDTMATAYALFDRALFSMKVKRSHVGVLGMILAFSNCSLAPSSTILKS